MILDQSVIAKPQSITKLLQQGNIVNNKNSKAQTTVVSPEIRLKRNRINLELIGLCRSYQLLWRKKDYPNCTILTPFER